MSEETADAPKPQKKARAARVPKPGKVRNIPLTVTSAESATVIRKLPAQVSVKEEPAYVRWGVPEGFEAERKKPHVLVITKAPNGTHRVTVEVLPKGAGALPGVGHGEVTLTIDVPAEPPPGAEEKK